MGGWFSSERTASGLVAGAAAIAVGSAVIAALKQFVDPIGTTGLYLLTAWVAPRRDGSGLLGLHDRLIALGGRLSVESPPGSGTRIAATLPLQR